MQYRLHGIKFHHDEGCGAVLFDWNGTLVDDASRAFDSANVALAAAALSPLRDVEAMRTTFRLPLVDWFERLGVPEHARHAAVSDWNAEMARRTAPLREGAHDLLAALRSAGIATGVVSAASLDAVTEDCERLGVAALLTRIDANATTKSNAIRSAIRALGAERAVYVGDTEYDMTEAAAAGAIPIAVSGGYRPDDALRQAGALMVCAGLADLRDLLAPS
jgi:HAD superfamily hydrolase (TIGR01549 family)